MNKDKIFNLFEDSTTIEQHQKAVEAFNKSYYHKLGMFTKLILNHFTFHNKLEKFLKQEEPSYNVESTKEASAFVVFNRAWSYIKQVNPENEEAMFTILDFNPKLLEKTLNSAISHFEEYEEYEKCAHIHKILQVLKRS